MTGWVLYKDTGDLLQSEFYEITRLKEVAEKRGIQLEIFSPEQFDLIVTNNENKSILVEGEYKPLPDFLIPRMGVTTTYFALAVIRHFERVGVQVINSSESVEAVKDKLYTHQILAKSFIPVPKTMLAKYPVDSDLIAREIGFPLVVKAIIGTQGSGVYLCNDKDNFEDVMQLINSTNSKANLILQEFVSMSKGRDLRVFVVGGRVVACIERKGKEGSFKANFSQGGSVTEYQLTPEIEWLATESTKLLGLDVAGIDLLFDGNGFKVCEANSSPGFKGIESCLNISIPDEIFNYISFRIHYHNKYK